jgi:hypothetical protein
MKRPPDGSQAGRILRLLESGGKVPLLSILSLQISQYSARIHDLRHRYGFTIENGSEPGRPDHTWFRLTGRETREEKAIHGALRSELEAIKPAAGLFSQAELERTARWEDVG